MQEHPTGLESPVVMRTDGAGRAFAGSQLQIQIAVSRRQDELSRATADAIGLPSRSSLVWKSPLEEERFAEYRDAAFLRVVGLEHLTPSLAAFWPRRGPCWDGLARIETAGVLSGVVLVEAKSYPQEMKGSGCRATGASLKQIQKALRAAQKWLSVPESADWYGPLYQFANRLSHVYFLRERHGIPTWLVNLCMVDDPTWKATSERGWVTHMIGMREQLGFSHRPIPWVADVFQLGRSRNELFGANYTAAVRPRESQGVTIARSVSGQDE